MSLRHLLVQYIAVVTVMLSATACSTLTPQEQAYRNIKADMEAGSIYRVSTVRNESLVMEVKSITKTQVVGLRQTVDIQDIREVENEITDPPKSAVLTATYAFVVVPLTVVAVLLIIVLV